MPQGYAQAALGFTLLLVLTSCFGPLPPELPPEPPPIPSWHSYNTVRHVVTNTPDNVYVVGDKGWEDIYLRRYDRTGTLLWTRALEKEAADETTDIDIDAVAAGPEGALYVAWQNALYRGDTVYVSWFLTAYDPEGQERWQVETNGVEDLAADASGNVYATEGGVGHITKYTPGGRVAWVRSGFPTPQSIAVSSAGHLYVARDDGAVVKYTREGDRLWLKKALPGNQDVDNTVEDCPDTGPCPTDVTDVRYEVAAGPDDTLYVTGGTFRYRYDGDLTATEDAELYLHKFDGTGTPEWRQRVATLRERSVNEALEGWVAFALDVDTNGAAYVATGRVDEGDCGPDSCTDAVVTKYEVSGERVWTTTAGTPELDGATSIATHDGQNVFVGAVTGGNLSDAGPGDPQALLRALDGDGEVVWAQRLFKVPDPAPQD